MTDVSPERIREAIRGAKDIRTTLGTLSRFFLCPCCLVVKDARESGGGVWVGDWEEHIPLVCEACWQENKATCKTGG